MVRKCEPKVVAGTAFDALWAEESCSTNSRQLFAEHYIKNPGAPDASGH